MTDFDYKKYSLEKLEEWVHDALSSGEATPQEIYDTIKKVVQEQYDYHKEQAERVNNLLHLLNGHKTLDLNLSSLYSDDHIKFNLDPKGNEIDFSNPGAGNTGYQYSSCGVGDTSDYCTNSWNSFWEDNTTKVDGYSIDGQSHSDYWYEYDRNDPNRPNPFKDKVVKWQLPVNVDGLTGDCYVNFPDDLLEATGLKEGDLVEWVDNNNGTYTLKKTQ